MRLLRVELRRLWARRLTKWMCLAVVAVVALTGLTVFASAAPPSEAEVAQAEEFYQQELETWEESGDEQIASCKEAEDSDPDENADYGCDDMAPKREWFVPSTATFVPATVEDLGQFAASIGIDPDADAAVAKVHASPWNQWSTGTFSVATYSIFLIVIVFALGVSFVTAEATSGALGLWLTFEPRRQRVYWSKAAAAALGTLPFTVAGVAALVGVVYAIFAGFGTLGELTGERWAEIAGFGGRLVAAGAAFALIGAALGALFRHAAAAAGVAFVAGLGSVVLTSVLGNAQRWAPNVNITAWIEGGALYGFQVCPRNADGMVTCQYVEKVVTQAQGGLYLLVLTLVLTVVAALVFRRRDVS